MAADRLSIDMILNGIRNSKNEIVYCLKDHVSGDWRKIGSTLGIDYVKLNEIRDDKSRFLNNGQRLEEVLIIWREDKRFKHYEFTKDGLCSLLKHSEHGTAAEKFEEYYTQNN